MVQVQPSNIPGIIDCRRESIEFQKFLADEGYFLRAMLKDPYRQRLLRLIDDIKSKAPLRYIVENGQMIPYYDDDTNELIKKTQKLITDYERTAFPMLF